MTAIRKCVNCGGALLENERESCCAAPEAVPKPEPCHLCADTVRYAVDMAVSQERALGRRLSLDLLEELEDYLDDHSDAEYVDGVPRGNRAMGLLSQLRDELGR